MVWDTASFQRKLLSSIQSNLLICFLMHTGGNHRHHTVHLHCGLYGNADSEYHFELFSSSKSHQNSYYLISLIMKWWLSPRRFLCLDHQTFSDALRGLYSCILRWLKSEIYLDFNLQSAWFLYIGNDILTIWNWKGFIHFEFLYWFLFACMTGFIETKYPQLAVWNDGVQPAWGCWYYGSWQSSESWIEKLCEWQQVKCKGPWMLQ